MARVNFTTGQRDVCPVCFLRKQMTEPDDLATSALALGCVSAVIADSPIELGELFASACPSHQKTVCGRVVEEAWPDSERFVYRDQMHNVNCPACRNQHTS